MNFEQARFNMVEQQIRPWEVLDQDVLDLLYVVPREEFVPPAHRALAFTDMEIPIGEGERMWAPKIEARVMQELALRKVDRVLEVGTGFHPELTGRENIFLNGSILGMSRREVSRKFDEIIDFAGVERFLDTPVKRYSSGMYVRLAFAIAAHLEPEILIVDEVLAVGDARFQKKCLGKMESVGKEGKTVLFVSHNMAAVKTLCNRGMLLENGQMAFMGAAEEAVEQYLGASILDRKEIVWSGAEAPGNRYIGVESIAVRPLHGAVIDIESGIEFSVGFVNKEAGKKISCALRLYTLDGICLFATGVFLSSDDEGDAEPGRYSARCVFPPNLLNVGAYKIHLMFVQNRRELLFGLEEAIAFEVEHTVKTVGGHMTPAQGLIRPKLDWTWQVSQEGS